MPDQNNEQEVPKTDDAQVEEEKKRKPGAKIEESPHRDAVATMLLVGQTYAYILRFLSKAGFPVKFETLKDFENNYVFSLAKEVQDQMVAKATEERRKQDEKIIQTAAYANMSKVDTIIQLLGEAEAQIESIRAEKTQSFLTRQEMGVWMDRIYKLRNELEESRTGSEVEIERTKAIKDVALIAVSMFKESPNIKEFITKTDGLISRSKQSTAPAAGSNTPTGTGSGSA